MEEHDQVHEDNTDNGDSEGGDEEDKVECQQTVMSVVENADRSF